MSPTTVEAFAVLVAFVLPGFLTVMIRERIYSSPVEVSPLDRLLGAVYYSVLTYLAYSIVVVLIPGLSFGALENFYAARRDEPAVLVCLGVLAALVPAALIAYAGARWGESDWRRKVLKRLRLNPNHQVHSAWDHRFANAPRGYVRAALSDGRYALGYYGGSSFAGYGRDTGDLYLQTGILTDPPAKFSALASVSGGIWVSREQVVGLEFYPADDMTEEDTGARPPRPTPGPNDERGGHRPPRDDGRRPPPPPDPPADRPSADDAPKNRS